MFIMASVCLKFRVIITKKYQQVPDGSPFVPSVVRDWLLLDPKIGVWLLDADHPPVTFGHVLAHLRWEDTQVGLLSRSL